MHASIHQAMYSTYGMLLLAAWLDMPAGHYSLTRSSLRCNYAAGTHATMLQGASPSTTTHLGKKDSCFRLQRGLHHRGSITRQALPQTSPFHQPTASPSNVLQLQPYPRHTAPLNSRQSTTT